MACKKVDDTPTIRIRGQTKVRGPPILCLLDKPAQQEFADSLASGIGVRRQSQAGNRVAFVPPTQHSIAKDATSNLGDEVLV